MATDLQSPPHKDLAGVTGMAERAVFSRPSQSLEYSSPAGNDRSDPGKQAAYCISHDRAHHRIHQLAIEDRGACSAHYLEGREEVHRKRMGIIRGRQQLDLPRPAGLSGENLH